MSAELQHDLRRYWTLADLEQLPGDGYRYEVLDGQLVVSPPPRVGHQLLADALCRLLRERGDLAVTGVGVHVPAGPGGEESYVVPDVLVLRSTPSLDAVAVAAGEVLLAAEVVSPGSRRRDRLVKPDLYAELGIAAYVLVDPEARTLVHGVLQQGRYAPVEQGLDWARLAAAAGLV